jgi:hypothetical protein
MNKVYAIRYGFAYEHSYILGVYENKKDAKVALDKFLENNTYGFNECYIEKCEFFKKKLNNGKS